MDQKDHFWEKSFEDRVENILLISLITYFFCILFCNSSLLFLLIEGLRNYTYDLKSNVTIIGSEKEEKSRLHFESKKAQTGIATHRMKVAESWETIGKGVMRFRALRMRCTLSSDYFHIHGKSEMKAIRFLNIHFQDWRKLNETKNSKSVHDFEMMSDATLKVFISMIRIDEKNVRKRRKKRVREGEGRKKERNRKTLFERKARLFLRSALVISTLDFVTIRWVKIFPGWSLWIDFVVTTRSISKS